jgi:hypothetical protein
MVTMLLLFVSKYCSITPILFEVVFWSSFISCPTFSIDVSSAYIIDLPCVRCGISFIYKVKIQDKQLCGYCLTFLFHSGVLIINTCFSVTWLFIGISYVTHCFIVGSLTNI